jgi:hypothetical protein
VNNRRQSGDPGEDPACPAKHMRRLVDLHAPRLLGISGEEFRCRWYALAYQDDHQPAVRALDRLMRTGHWQPPLEDTPPPDPTPA